MWTYPTPSSTASPEAVFGRALGSMRAFRDPLTQDEILRVAA
jgi:hypothetical protein